MSKTWSNTSQISFVLPSAGRVAKWLAAAAILVLVGAGYWAWVSGRTPGGGATGSPAAAAKTPLTIMRFENRTGDASLDPIGQLAADAISQELPQLQFLRARGGDGPRQNAVVTGAYYLDGQNIRIQATLADSAGNALHTIEPATAPRTDPGNAVDLVQQRMLGTIVTILDPGYTPGPLSRPPLYSAYRGYLAAVEVFGEDPATAVSHLKRATEFDPDYFDAWHLMAMGYMNMGDRTRQRETVERMTAMRDRLGPFDRVRQVYAVHALELRPLDALKALREAEKLDPDNLNTNYLIGWYALRLNRPQETIDAYASVDAERYNRLTVGLWRRQRLATAHHLLGRHEEELRIATAAKALYPSSLGGHESGLMALAALGRVDDLRRAVDEAAGLTTIGGGSPGILMRVAAEELRAHGHRAESIEMAKRSVAWHRNRPTEYLAAPANRLSLAQSLYVAEEWADAGKVVIDLLKTNPGNTTYIGLAGAVAARSSDRSLAMKYATALANAPPEPYGVMERRRAQIAALVGDRDRAVELLRDGFARFLWMNEALHRQMDFESLRGYAPFDELMRPKG